MALVLSRKSQEEIVIGDPGPDQVVIKVIGWDARRQRIRIGIQAGQHIRVLRGEKLQSCNSGDKLAGEQCDHGEG